MKYRKKPVVIEAFIWTGGPNQLESPEWIISAMKSDDVKILNIGLRTTLAINTLEGIHYANPGDYIIQGVKGEIYPCKPDIFEMTYDKLVED